MAFVFHIGFPKAASTFLQEEVFPDIQGITYETIWYPEKFVHNKENLDKFQDTVYLGSSETFLEDPIKQSNFFVEALSQFGPNTKIIIIVRSQYTALRSHYHRLLKGGYNKTFNVFLKDSEIVHFVKYDDIISQYINTFGQKNVLVIPFELLHENKTMFIDDIVDFVSGNINKTEFRHIKKSLTDIDLFFLRIYNNITGNNSNNVNLFGKILFKVSAVIGKICKILQINTKEIILSKKMKLMIDTMYDESNRALLKSMSDSKYISILETYPKQK